MNIKKSDYVLTIFTSLVIGMWVAVGIGHFSEVIPLGKSAKTSVEECQKTLPRNVECVIVAVPETDLENVED